MDFLEQRFATEVINEYSVRDDVNESDSYEGEFSQLEDLDPFE